MSKFPLHALLPILIGAWGALGATTVPGARADEPARAPADISAGASSQETAAYQSAFTLYSQGAYDAASAQLALFEREYPAGAQLPQAENLHGLALLLSRHPLDAATHFKRAIGASRSDSFNQYVLYNLAKAQFEAGDGDGAQASVASIKLEVLDRENKLKVYFLRARLLLRKHQALDSARESLAASRLLSEMQVREMGEARGTLVAFVDEALREVQGSAELETLFRDYEDSPLIDHVLFRLGSQAMARGDREVAEVHLRGLMTRFPQSDLYQQAAELLRSTQDAAPADGATIGVLLPLKGKFARFGNQALQAIELAFRVFNVGEPDSGVKLVIEDSGEDADQASRALERLVSQQHAIAVIGPLLSKGIDKVTAKAQALGVPLVSLARYPGTQGEFVFQSGLTVKLQAREIARYAIEKLGLKRFAILHARDKVGQEFAQNFWDAVESLGGEITGYETYSPGETDFKQSVDRLAGLYYTEARARELDDLAKQREAGGIKKLTRKTEAYYKVKPLADFDAVFIPDEPRISGQILPTFAYRDVDRVRFLGTAAWNSPDFPARAEGAGMFSLFPDAFTPDSATPAVRRFIEKYKATYGQDPSSGEALAYDAGRLVEAVLSPPTTSRIELRERLRNLKDFEGVTGKIAYVDGQFSRDLKILTVRAGRISEAGDSPPAPGPKTGETIAPPKAGEASVGAARAPTPAKGPTGTRQLTPPTEPTDPEAD
jgi:ABC-type branched-subunit amino acid transport system substrate-binding protein/TolA-binding protein